ncbi:hypothetical protein G6M50_01430 [Agrobacterium rhizogenes]|nr:hypothetical protein [Rhizobium rhizogenes]NTJ76453.1 hypothetical protein [Rhizobium rhizogenes]
MKQTVQESKNSTCEQGGPYVALAGIIAVSGVLAELIAVNRRLLEEIKIKQLQQQLGTERQPIQSSLTKLKRGLAK